MNYSAQSLPRIGLTIGDPAGIGPEVTLKAALSDDVLAICQPVIIGDAAFLNEWAQRFGLPQIAGTSTRPTELAAPLIYDLKNLTSPIEIGTEQAAAGRAAADYIETAVPIWRTRRDDDGAD
jgi:4-phospho-D-threonate 3-dehydrogenase / 4-phospho-D-erythronate 3-dehydrogenase